MAVKKIRLYNNTQGRNEDFLLYNTDDNYANQQITYPTISNYRFEERFTNLEFSNTLKTSLLTYGDDIRSFHLAPEKWTGITYYNDLATALSDEYIIEYDDYYVKIRFRILTYIVFLENEYSYNIYSTLTRYGGVYNYDDSVISEFSTDNIDMPYRDLKCSLIIYNVSSALNPNFPNTIQFIPSQTNVIFVLDTNDDEFMCVSVVEFNNTNDTPSKQTVAINNIGEMFVDLLDVTDNPQGPDSGTGGGDGGRDDGSDGVDIPGLPSVSFIDNGTISMYRLTDVLYGRVGEYLWSTDFIDQFKKLIVEPLQVIINLMYFPINPDNLPLGSFKQIVFGNVPAILADSELVGQSVTKQSVQVDCGSVFIDHYSNDFLDYAPNTEIALHLPFIGDVAIDVADVMGKTMRVVYNIDLLTGSGVCFVHVSGNGLSAVMYSYSCNLGTQIPLTSANFAQMYTGLLSVVTGSVMGFATAGAAGALIGGGLSAANTVSNSKPTYSRTNAQSGGVSYLGMLTPYLKITRARTQKPANFNNFDGFTSYITYTLGELSGYGYTKFSKIFVGGIVATDEEKQMLQDLLTSEQGVIL